MKIWCCLCFTQDDDEPGEEDSEDAMKDDGFENEGNSEGGLGNEEVPEDVPRLGLAADGRDRDDNARVFQEIVEAMPRDEVVNFRSLALLRASFRTSRLSTGEGSSASAASADENSDHDSHNKRAKVHSDFQ